MARLLQRVVANLADRPTLVDEQGSWTGHQLDARVNRWMWVLREHGLRTGDRIAFVVGNRRETFEALLACLHSGLVVVPINWHLTTTEIAYVLADSGSRAVLTDAARLAATAGAIAESGTEPVLRLVCGPDDARGFVAAESQLALHPDAEPEEQESGSVMLYTSGTTGKPKGVVTNLFVAGASLVRVLKLVDRFRGGLGIPGPGATLLVGPWYHSAQLFFSVFPLLAGNGLVMRERFDPAATLRDIDELQVGQCHLVPTQFVRLLRLPAAVRAGFDGSSLDRVWHGGGACPVEVKRAMIDWWGPVISEYYAATEGGIVALIRSEEWLAKPGSVGRAAPPNEIVILDDDGTELPRNSEGMIYVRRSADEDFRYHNAPEKTRGAYVAPGTFTFGDRGHLDEDGFLYVTGRATDMVISGGVNIYPAEVESVLQTHPVVRDAAVFGIPDAEFGERVHAVVMLEDGAADQGPAGDGADAAAALHRVLDAFCRRSLAGFKVPRSYEVVAELPREASGKLRKHLLREPYWRLPADA